MKEGGSKNMAYQSGTGINMHNKRRNGKWGGLLITGLHPGIHLYVFFFFLSFFPIGKHVWNLLQNHLSHCLDS